MSTAVLPAQQQQQQQRSEGASTSKRRSLFKPSTWASSSSSRRASSAAASPPLSSEAAQHEEEATIDPSPPSPPHDGIESGAGLTSLIPPAEPHHSHFASPSTNSGVIVGATLAFQPDAHGRIPFWNRDQPNWLLSNSHPTPVTFNGVVYPTAEHLFQCLKFPSHPELAAKIRKAKTPLEALRIARSNTHLLPPGWIADGLNVRTMHKVVLAKFAQYEALQEALLRTEECEIVNEIPTDVFWGVGAEGRGRNVLGKIMAGVREVLRQNAGVGIGSGAKTLP